MKKLAPNNLNVDGDGSGNTLNGTAGADVIRGFGGNDILDGKAGADRLEGGTGDDWFFVDNAADVVVEAAGEGNDRVFASVSYTLGAGQSVEKLTTTSTAGTTAINLTGNELAQEVWGNDGANILDGKAGADSLYGLKGDDWFYVDNAGDRVIETAGQGNDRVFTSVSYTLGAGVSVEKLTTTNNLGTIALNLTGNELAQDIYGNDGNNILDGKTGADLMVGLKGDDWFYVDAAGDRVSELAGEGNDRVFASVSYTLAAGVSVEKLTTTANTGTGAINLTGNELAQDIYGNDGANSLDGKGGADLLVGLKGDDFYYVDNALDRISELAGEGNDRVFASASYTLAAGVSVEKLTTTNNAGTIALNLTGNELAQDIYGNDGANSLDGKGGADLLVGLKGDDLYYVDNVADRISEAAGEGNDRVFASTSYTLAAGTSVEKLTTSNNNGTDAINLTGNELAQDIYGNAGNNILDGNAGADFLAGLLGDDWYIVDNAADRVSEAAGEGNDRVFASVSYALGAGQSVEQLSTTNNAGTTAINLTGNELAQTISGNDGNNILDGKGGVDILAGLKGDDWFSVDNAADLVQELAGEGNDRIFASVSYILAAGVSVEKLSTANNAGTGAIDLTGNELANEMFGNAGANVLDGKGGADTLTGLGGADVFAFTTALGGGNIDRILDFQTGLDEIALVGDAGQPFAALASGALRAGTLVIGTAALDADDYLIYNSTTGALLYDADGNGAGAAVQFATLSTGLGLTVADFTVSGAANTAPAITSGATASVAENSNASTIVYQTVASDADGDRITYSLSGTDASLLSIDANGAVRLKAPADFETKNSYVFNVIASDSGVATVKAVTLTITDVNDNVSTPIINETAASNDTQGTAQSIDPGTFVIANNPDLYNAAYPSASIHGSISAPGDVNNVSSDVDFYSITLQAGQQLILDVDIDPANGLDSFLSLYGPNGVLIGDNDDLISSDPGSGTQFGHNTDSQIIFRAATGGTYYFSIKAYADETAGPQSKGDYVLNVSVNSTPATPQQIMAEDVQALVSGASWNHAGPAFNLTYGFPTLASYYPQTFDEVSSSGAGDPVPVFEAFNATQQTATRALLQLVANVTQITFSENTVQGDYNTAGTAANANLRYAESDEAEVAYAYYPTNAGPSSVGGSAWFNHDDFNTPVRGNYAWMGILHETGHALGLKHGHEFPLAVSADHDSLEYTVMTYRSYPGGDIQGYTNETWGYAQTLMMLDIAALQKIYGSANYNYNSGDSVYTWSLTTGEMSINGAGQGAPGNGVGGSANRVFLTIWDGGGEDTYNLSNYASGMTIDLRPGEWVNLNMQTANLGDGHFARGNVANALLYEGDTRSLIENAIGGSGNDTFIANQAANELTGGGGQDLFKWLSTADAGTGSLADTILDFQQGTDQIHLYSADAVPSTPANDDFTWIGTAAFSNVAGQLRYQTEGGDARIQADVDGNGTSDFEILVVGHTTLTIGDFFF